MGASLASCRNIKPVVLAVGLDPEKVKPFPSCAKIEGPFGTIKFGVQGMKEHIEEMSLIFLRDPDAEIHDFQLDPLTLSIQSNPDHPFVRRILDSIPQKANQRGFEDVGIDGQAEVLVSIYLKLDVPMTGLLFHILQDALSKRVKVNDFSRSRRRLPELLGRRFRLYLLVKTDDVIGLLLNIREATEIFLQGVEDLCSDEGSRLTLNLSLQNPDASLNDGKRCPQFMGKMIESPAFCSIELFELCLRMFQGLDAGLMESGILNRYRSLTSHSTQQFLII